MPADYYVLKVNNADRLFLLADAPETDVPDPAAANVINVLDFLPAQPRAGLLTEHLQKALDEASRTKKILFFPPGEYLTGTLSIGSNTSVYLSKGAVIQGSPNREDYPADEGRLESDHVNRKADYTDNGEWMTFSRLILVDKAKNVKIYGRGVIDGNGAVVRAQGRPANLLRIRQSKNVLIEGVMLRDPAAWNTHIIYSDKVTVRNVKILNDPLVHNTDGFNPDASTKVLIENCFAYCSDDNVAIKTTNNMGMLKNTNRVTVRGNVFLTRKSALKVGTETKAKALKNIVFIDNDIVECDRALVLYCHDGALFKNIKFIDIRVEKNFPDNQRMLIHFLIRNRNGAGKIRNVSIEDCVFYEEFPRRSVMQGLNDENNIENVTIKNLVVNGKKVNSLEEARINATHVKKVRFK